MSDVTKPSDEQIESVRVKGQDTWEDVPGEPHRQPDSTVRITFQTHSGSLVRYLAPGDVIYDAWDDPSAAEVMPLNPALNPEGPVGDPSTDPADSDVEPLDIVVCETCDEHPAQIAGAQPTIYRCSCETVGSPDRPPMESGELPGAWTLIEVPPSE